MTATMTQDEAREFRRQREALLGRLSRMSKTALVSTYQSQGGLGGGTWSKGDLTGSILEQRYPITRLNLAVHTLYHDVAWPDCRWCTGSTS